MSIRLLVMAMSFAVTVMAADVSGRWDGTVGTKPEPIGVYLNLIQHGRSVSGTLVIREAKEVPIERGELHGSDLTFEVHDSANRVLKFHLTLKDGAMEGQRTLGDELSQVTFSRAPNSQAYPVNTGITSAPVLLHKVEPEYTEQARQAGFRGTVVLQVEIEADGRVGTEHVRVVHSVGMGLDEKAIECVRQWRFRPAYRDGKPVASPAGIEVNFRQ